MKKGVNEPDRCHPAQIAAQRPPGARADRGDVAALARRKEADEPAPDLLAVLEEEEQQDEREQCAGDHLGKQQRAADDAARDRAPIRAQLVQPALDRAIDLTLGETERTLNEPVADPFDPRADVEVEVVELGADRKRDHPAHARRCGEAGDDDHQRRETAWPAAHRERASGWHEQRCQEERREARQKDEPEPGDDQRDDDDRGGNEQQTPAQARGEPQRAGNRCWA
jgi:hypothetical protein